MSENPNQPTNFLNAGIKVANDQSVLFSIGSDANNSYIVSLPEFNAVGNLFNDGEGNISWIPPSNINYTDFLQRLVVVRPVQLVNNIFTNSDLPFIFQKIEPVGSSITHVPEKSEMSINVDAGF
jgi:hypothetical protein